ncbi:hypothetical protein G5S34_08625 [Herbaspirillum frisingense]|nr:hypothetical protein G5S34_08625 [Herbaspirillum frisingense]
MNTHPDADHASGLEVVLEQFTVGEVRGSKTAGSKMRVWLVM